MDAKLKTKWVKALRSGRYKQARETLRSDAGYCCLGVLCKAVLKVDLAATATDTAYFRAYAAIDPASNNNKHSRILIEMNDGGRSFDQIADYIEREL